MNDPAQPADRRVAVIGAGILGLATARALRERGEEAVIYESGIPGNGQSAAESRIFRHSHDDARLVELAKESRAIWSEWERDLGLEMISGDGVVALGEPALERLAVIERAGGADVAEIASEQVSERLPPLAPYNGAATVDASGGAIRTRNAIEALTRELDGSFRFGEVIALRQVRPGAVEVRAGGEAAEYERVVVCAGRGTAALARGVGLCLPLAMSAHVRVAFAVRGKAPRRLACLQDSSGEFGETGIYGAPMPDRSGYAVGLSETVETEDDASLVDPRELASHAERVVAYVERALPGLDPKPVGHLHCWVTALPWNDDAVAISEHGDLLFAYGHNLFKLAPAIGHILARAALGEGVDERLRSEARLGEPVDQRRSPRG